MADPLSIAASVTGVVGACIGVAKALSKFLDDWEDAPEQLDFVAAQIRTNATMLSCILHIIEEHESLFRGEFETLVRDLNWRFRTVGLIIEKCMKGKWPKKLTKLKWLVISRRVNGLMQKLEMLKTTLALVLNMAQMAEAKVRDKRHETAVHRVMALNSLNEARRRMYIAVAEPQMMEDGRDLRETPSDMALWISMALSAPTVPLLPRSESSQALFDVRSQEQYATAPLVARTAAIYEPDGQGVAFEATESIVAALSWLDVDAETRDVDGKRQVIVQEVEPYEVDMITGTDAFLRNKSALSALPLQSPFFMQQGDLLLNRLLALWTTLSEDQIEDTDADVVESLSDANSESGAPSGSSAPDHASDVSDDDAASTTSSDDAGMEAFWGPGQIEVHESDFGRDPQWVIQDANGAREQTTAMEDQFPPSQDPNLIELISKYRSELEEERQRLEKLQQEQTLRRQIEDQVFKEQMAKFVREQEAKTFEEIERAYQEVESRARDSAGQEILGEKEDGQDKFGEAAVSAIATAMAGRPSGDGESSREVMKLTGSAEGVAELEKGSTILIETPTTREQVGLPRMAPVQLGDRQQSAPVELASSTGHQPTSRETNQRHQESDGLGKRLRSQLGSIWEPPGDMNTPTDIGEEGHCLIADTDKSRGARHPSLDKAFSAHLHRCQHWRGINHLSILTASGLLPLYVRGNDDGQTWFQGPDPVHVVEFAENYREHSSDNDLSPTDYLLLSKQWVNASALDTLGFLHVDLGGPYVSLDPDLTWDQLDVIIKLALTLREADTYRRLHKPDERIQSFGQVPPADHFRRKPQTPRDALSRATTCVGNDDQQHGDHGESSGKAKGEVGAPAPRVPPLLASIIKSLYAFARTIC